jgi:hypothetical protein
VNERKSGGKVKRRRGMDRDRSNSPDFMMIASSIVVMVAIAISGGAPTLEFVESKRL